MHTPRLHFLKDLRRLLDFIGILTIIIFMKKQILCVILFLMCCNKLPIGEDELNQRGIFDAVNIELLRFNTLTESNEFAYLGNSWNLVFGKNEDYESRILLKFDFPDTAFQGLDEIKLIIKRNDNFHRDTVKFNIHLLEFEFEEDKANWYQRTELEWWETEGGDFQEEPLRSGEVVDDSLVVTFNYIELERLRSAEGLIIVPADSGFVYFYSEEGGDAPQFILVKNDVITSISLEADCHIVTGPIPFYIESWLGSGVPYRNYAKFVFDSILIGKKAIYAELTFEIEDYFVMRDSVEIGVKELLEPIDDFETPTGPFIALEKFSIDDTLFSIDMLRHIHRLIEHPDSNFGFFLILSPENYDIANLKIVHGSHRLQVGYISPPEERW